jgi:hypothetical protein
VFGIGGTEGGRWRVVGHGDVPTDIYYVYLGEWHDGVLDTTHADSRLVALNLDRMTEWLPTYVLYPEPTNDDPNVGEE